MLASLKQRSDLLWYLKMVLNNSSCMLSSEAAVRQVLPAWTNRSSQDGCWSRICFLGFTLSRPGFTEPYFCCLRLLEAHSTPLVMALWLIVTDVIHIQSNGADLKYKAAGFTHISVEIYLSSAAKIRRIEVLIKKKSDWEPLLDWICIYRVFSGIKTFIILYGWSHFQCLCSWLC